MFATVLTHRGVVAVTGAEARGFLDRLLTNTIATVTPEAPCHAALLTPQGKIIAEMIVNAIPDAEGGGFLLDCLRAAADPLADRLAFYKLRAKVEIRDVSAEARVVALWGADAPGALPHAAADPRLAALGWRTILDVAEVDELLAAAGTTPASERDWHRLRIAHGVPDAGEDFILGETYPHEADMDQLAGIDFTKGCFVGQEVVSRMQHRGTARTRVVPITSTDGSFLVEAGLPVTVGERRIGMMGSSVEGFGMALLRLDHAAEALTAGTPMMTGGVSIRPLKPSWATFEVPGA